MKKENLLLIISLLLAVFVLLFSIYSFSTKKEPETEIKQEVLKEEEIVETEILPEDIEPEVKKEFVHSAWIPAWDFDNGFKSLEKYKDLISSVNPVLYGVNSDGTLLNRKPSEESLKKFLAFCDINGIEVLPTVGSYDYKIMDSVMGSEVYIDKQVEEIIKEVEKYDFDGIDIDFEKIRVAQKDGYLLFLKKLQTELHMKEKKLSVTVIAKTREATIDTLAVQDWKVIGELADQFKIMTYDYTLQSSTIPGPIAPIDWMKEVIDYANVSVPSEKIFLGIHLYAYLWKGDKASALTYSSVQNLLNNSSITQEYKSDIAEGYSKYTCSDGSSCILYFQNKQGVSQRVSLAKESNLLGVSYWRLGSELDLLDQ